MTNIDDGRRSPAGGTALDSPLLPEFESAVEIREFWDTHDSAPYWDQMEDVTNNPPPELAIGPGRSGSRAPRRPSPDQTKTLSFDVPADLADAVKAFAYLQRRSYQELLRSWIADRVAEERRQYAGRLNGDEEVDRLGASMHDRRG